MGNVGLVDLNYLKDLNGGWVASGCSSLSKPLHVTSTLFGTRGIVIKRGRPLGFESDAKLLQPLQMRFIDRKRSFMTYSSIYLRAICLS